MCELKEKALGELPMSTALDVLDRGWKRLMSEGLVFLRDCVIARGCGLDVACASEKCEGEQGEAKREEEEECAKREG